MQSDYRDNLNNKIDECYTHVAQANTDNHAVTLILKLRRLDMVLEVCEGGEMLPDFVTLSSLNGAKLMLRMIKQFVTVSTSN